MNQIGPETGKLAAEEASILHGEVRDDLIADELLSEIFAAVASRAPASRAMVCGDRTWTYAEIDAEANAIARGLVAKGVKAGHVVGLWMPRGGELLITQIAITKTGAAWLPFDADSPVERISVCLHDAEAKGLLTSANSQQKAIEAGLTVWTPDEIADRRSKTPVDARRNGATAQSPAYLIYTSGSTGVPKGIVITQANICHYLRSANTIFDIRADDVVFQGASVAFDLSMEEIWIPYLAGATLYVATPDVMSDTDKLPDVWNAAGITVVDTVPTLLSLISKDVPSLRLIILGGEACPPALVARWSSEGRRIYNSYGPTEATVVATIAEVVPGRPVTIGKPIPNYTTYVADENLNLLPVGVQGELLIGGPGVAKGYLKRNALTAEKFIGNPFGGVGRDPVLYRSGDAVSIDADGNIAFHGRIDDQVKIRGFRVELGEIESRIADQKGINQAAVVVRSDGGMDQLAAFVVLETGAAFDAPALRGALRQQLPPYMVPSRFEVVESLPRLSSGKVDRKQLKARPLAVIENAGKQEDPETETEKVLLAAAKRVFPGQNVPFQVDFFTELGGHSLIAAQFISAVRETPKLAGITLQDVYTHRTLRNIGHGVDSRSGSAGGQIDLRFTPVPFMRRFLCGCAQAAALPFILGLVTIQWLGLFLSSIWLLQDGAGFWIEMLVLLGVYVVLNIGTKLAVVGIKWLVMGRTKPGRYPLWGVYYFRVWFTQRLIQVITLKFLQSSPLMRWYMRALGAKIGKDAIIAEFEAGAIDLISIGDRASIGLKTKFANVEIIGNEMIVGRIDIGNDAYIGNSCVIGWDARISDGAELGDLTAIRPGTHVRALEAWDGSPARKIGVVDLKEHGEFPEASPLRRFIHACVYSVSYVVVLMLGLLPIFPAFYILYNLDYFVDGAHDYDVPWRMLPLYTWPTALVLIVAAMTIIVAVRWLVLPRVRAGTYSIHSNFYLRKWIVGLATEVTLETLNSLYATIYMRFWYRLMGAKIGKGSEISTNLAGRYDLVDIGSNNFLGDEVIFGDEELRNGWMTLKTVKTGDRVFLGNDAIVPGGAVLEDGALVGVKSRIPPSLHVKKDETWFGSPAMLMPNRQKVQLGSNWTYEPPKWFIWVRALFEACHTALPTAAFITCGYITADIIQVPLLEGKWLKALGIFLAAGVVIALAMIALSAVVKWVLIGRYKPTMKPMWSFWAMRTEAVAVLYGGLVGKASVEFLRGTPFLPWVLRVYGTKIGKGVWMDLTDLTEFDCIKIGDHCTLNMNSCLQTHLYEDRIMKVGRVEVAEGVHVGWGTTVLYDTKIGAYAQLSGLTMVMKGEQIPAHSSWAGAPAVPAPPCGVKEKATADAPKAALQAA